MLRMMTWTYAGRPAYGRDGYVRTRATPQPAPCAGRRASVAAIPNGIDDTSRLAASAAATPATSPIDATTSASCNTIHARSRGRAPSAPRMPSSRRSPTTPITSAQGVVVRRPTRTHCPIGSPLASRSARTVRSRPLAAPSAASLCLRVRYALAPLGMTATLNPAARLRDPHATPCARAASSPPPRHQ